MSIRVAGFALLLFTFSPVAETQPVLVESHICPFDDGCQFTCWILNAPLPVYAREGDTSSYVQTLQSGDSLVFRFGNMHIEKMGVVKIVRPIEPFGVGDTIFILSPVGDGYYHITNRGGYRSTVDWFWTRDTVDNDYEGVLIEQPQMTWWVSVSDSRGRGLWLRLVNTEQYYGFSYPEAIEMIREPMEEE